MPPAPNDGYDRLHDLIVLTHEDTNGKIYAFRHLLFAIWDGDYQTKMNNGAKGREIKRLESIFCEGILFPDPLTNPFPWLQPADSEFTFFAGADG